MIFDIQMLNRPPSPSILFKPAIPRTFLIRKPHILYDMQHGYHIVHSVQLAAVAYCCAAAVPVSL